METVNSDIISSIAFYLGYIHIFALALTSTHIRSMIDSRYLDFSLVIKSRLTKIFGFHADLLHENLSKYERYLGGSFVLQAIYGEEWQRGDIDIYYLGEYCKGDDYLDDEFMYTIVNKKEAYDQALSNGCEVDDVDHYCKSCSMYEGHDNYGLVFDGKNNYVGLPVHSLYYKLPLSETMIDYITIPSSNKYPECRIVPLSKTIFDFHEQAWDIDICKVVYDGRRLYVSNLENLFLRRATARCTKAFAPENDLTINLFKLLKNMQRIKKYRSRGFIIDLEYDPYEVIPKERNRAISMVRTNSNALSEINCIYWNAIRLL